MAKSKEELIQEILEEFEKDGDPVTYEEAVQIAEDEIRANQCKKYIQSEDTEKKPKKPKERKVDDEKGKILGWVQKSLSDNANVECTQETETKLHFTYNGNDYTIMLTKHKKKKG